MLALALAHGEASGGDPGRARADPAPAGGGSAGPLEIHPVLLPLVHERERRRGAGVPVFRVLAPPLQARQAAQDRDPPPGSR